MSARRNMTVFAAPEANAALVVHSDEFSFFLVLNRLQKVVY
jgi:hypothetical protein